MTSNNIYNQYKENSALTASPEELTFMLYNGLVKFIMQSQLALEEKKIEKANSLIIKSQNIIREFQSTLDMKYAISQILALLYDYMYRRLIDANIKKDNEIIEEVLGLAKELRDTWAQAMKIAKQNHPKQAMAE